MTESNANGFTAKEMLVEMRGMLAAHIEESGKAHAAFMAQMAAISERQATHEADNHATIVKRLEDESLREAGRRDVLKYIFGTSVIGLICGVGGLAIGIFKMVTG